MDIDISIVLAKFWGLFHLVFSLLLIGTDQLNKTIVYASDKKFVIATGYSTLILGLMTVSLHNYWVADWRLLITILGWSTLLKGIHKIGFPESIAKESARYKNKQNVSFLIMFLLSLFLVSKGFRII